MEFHISSFLDIRTTQMIFFHFHEAMLRKIQHYTVNQPIRPTTHSPLLISNKRIMSPPAEPEVLPFAFFEGSETERSVFVWPADRREKPGVAAEVGEIVVRARAMFPSGPYFLGLPRFFFTRSPPLPPTFSSLRLTSYSKQGFKSSSPTVVPALWWLRRVLLQQEVKVLCRLQVKAKGVKVLCRLQVEAKGVQKYSDLSFEHETLKTSHIDLERDFKELDILACVVDNEDHYLKIELASNKKCIEFLK
ncbi:hypothetical protein M5K25_013425 [Dendrobium thyrsiflorum]|uniref:Uncharacterized protein n=1 Tax=Dendrobium thyrsiflorum TaxID=117978 RepID=A0ABD0UTV4_DENTH